jgi:hypothetical protein
MNVEYMAYPWLKDLDKFQEANANVLDALVRRLNALESKIQYLEAQIPNQKPQQHYTYSTSTGAGVIPSQGMAGGTAQFGSAGGIKK